MVYLFRKTRYFFFKISKNIYINMSNEWWLMALLRKHCRFRHINVKFWLIHFNIIRRFNVGGKKKWVKERFIIILQQLHYARGYHYKISSRFFFFSPFSKMCLFEKIFYDYTAISTPWCCYQIFSSHISFLQKFT